MDGLGKSWACQWRAWWCIRGNVFWLTWNTWKTREAIRRWKWVAIKESSAEIKAGTLQAFPCTVAGIHTLIDSWSHVLTVDMVPSLAVRIITPDAFLILGNSFPTSATWELGCSGARVNFYVSCWWGDSKEPKYNCLFDILLWVWIIEIICTKIINGWVSWNSLLEEATTCIPNAACIISCGRTWSDIWSNKEWYL